MEIELASENAGRLAEKMLEELGEGWTKDFEGEKKLVVYEDGEVGLNVGDYYFELVGNDLAFSYAATGDRLDGGFVKDGRLEYRRSDPRGDPRLN